MSMARWWKVSSSIIDRRTEEVHAKRTRSSVELMNQENPRDRWEESYQVDLKLTLRSLN